MSESRRVVITGLGVVSPIGIGRDAFWSSLKQGKNGIRPIKSFDTTPYKMHWGGEVQNFTPSKFIRNVNIPESCRSSQLAVASARLALDDSNLDKKLLLAKKDKIGVIVGSTTADPSLGEACINVWETKGYAKTPVEFGKNLWWATVFSGNFNGFKFCFFGLG